MAGLVGLQARARRIQSDGIDVDGRSEEFIPYPYYVPFRIFI